MEYLHSEPFQESCLLLACLDYLKSVRRKTALVEEESLKCHLQPITSSSTTTTKVTTPQRNSHIHKDYVTLAIWALTRSIQGHEDIQCDMEKLASLKYPSQEEDGKDYKYGNDPYLSTSQILKQKKMKETATAASSLSSPLSNAELYRHRWSSKSALLKSSLSSSLSSSSSSALSSPSCIGKLTPDIILPTLEMMEQEILFTLPSSSSSSYTYNDFHYSNSHRYYTHKGLASSPLLLPTIVQEGLLAMNAKTRMEAEQDFEKDPMYLEFLEVVQSKGFLTIQPTEVMIRKRENAKYKDHTLEQVKQDMYIDRLKKVKHKFRNKVYASSYSTSSSWNPYVSETEPPMKKVSPHSNLYSSASIPSTSTLSKEFSLPSIPTSSSEPDDYDDGLYSMTSTKSGKASLARDTKSKQRATHIKSNVTTGTIGMATKSEVMDHITIKDKLQKANRKIVPLKKPIVSSVPMTASIKSVEGDHESLNFHEDDLCSRMSQKSGKMSQGSLSTTKDDPEKVKEAEMFKAKGNECMKEKRYEKAKNFYTQAIDVLPFGRTSHVYYCNRAAALLSMRYFSEAAFDAEQSIELKPHYSKAYCRLGLANFFLGDYKKALDAYSMALQYDPDNESSLAYVERCKKMILQLKSEIHPFNDQKDFGNVKHHGAKVPLNHNKMSSDASPPNEGVHPNQRDSTQGDKENEPHSSYMMEKKKSMEEARRVLYDKTSDSHISGKPLDKTDEKISRNIEDDANEFKVKGNKAMAMKNYREAIKCYTNAIRISPAGLSSHVFFVNRAAAYCYLELYEDSESDAERALALKPDFGKAHSRLGLSRYFLGDYDGSIEAYENAITYDPDNEVNRAYLEKAKRRLLESKRR